MAGTESIRDVIAFPKTTSAQCLMTGAPSPVPDKQLAEVHVSVRAAEPLMQPALRRATSADAAALARIGATFVETFGASLERELRSAAFLRPLRLRARGRLRIRGRQHA
jgi:hypothetical protein